MSSRDIDRTPGTSESGGTLRWRQTLRFAGTALALILVFLAPYPLFEDLHRDWFRGSSQIALELCTSSFEIDFVDGEVGSSKDTTIVVRSKSGESANEKLLTDVSSRWIGYAPFAVFAALILATPFAWRSRLRKLVRGFVILELFLVLRLALLPVQSFVHHFEFCFHPSIHTSPWTESSFLPRALAGVSAAVSETMIFQAIPIGLWLIVLARGGNWRVFVAFDSRGTAHE